MKRTSPLLKASAFAVTAMLVAACSNDIPTPTTGDGNVTFTATLADVSQTRAFGKADGINELTCVVFDKDGNVAFTKTVPVESLKATVSLQLIREETYDIAFFATNNTEVYELSSDNKTLTVNYDKMNVTAADAAVLADDECFFSVRTGYVAGSSSSENVLMTRPVAQINVGSDDQDAKTLAQDFPNGIYTGITMQAYESLDFRTGEVIGTASVVTIPAMKYDTLLAEESFPEVDATKTYKYLAYGYALVPDSGDVSDIRIEAFNAATSNNPVVTVNVPSAPLKPNYRTNIYGSLLTSSSDWNVNIAPGWGGGENIGTNIDNLGKGGTYLVNEPIDEITVPEELDAPITFNIGAKVGKMTIGTNSQPITINVAKDVEYPEIIFTAGSTVKGLTINGDPDSDKTISGFNFKTDTSLSRPEMLEDLTLNGLTFYNSGFEPQYSCSTLNTVIRDCKFLGMTDGALQTQQTGAGTKFTCKDIVIDSCLIEFADKAKEKRNGLYLIDLTGNVTVTNTTIKDCTYIGISVAELKGAGPLNVEVTGNTVTGAKTDGVKVMDVTGTVVVAGNTIDSGENGIRLKNSIGTADITVTGNTIDMVNVTGEWKENDGEPSAILLFNDAANEGAKVIVKENTISNSNGHDFSVRNITYAEGSDVQNPFTK